MSLLNTLNDLLVAQYGTLGPILAVGGAGMVMILLALAVLMHKGKDPLDRLTKPSAPDMARAAALRPGGQNKNLEKFSSFLEPQDIEEYSAIRTKMIQAGYRTRDAVRIYYFAQFALGLGLLAVGVLYYFSTKDPEAPASLTTTLMTILGPGAAGYMLPKYWVTRRQAERQEQVAQGFPDSLDMLLVCVEAGQSLDQAITRVSTELRTGFPALAEEFEMVSLELKAGKDKVTVLRDFAERAGNDDIASFVTVLVQSQTYGTSIAEALRVYASEMRDKRVMRAEEKANTLPVKMTLTTMMLTVPPLLIILVGPSVIDIAKVFGGD